MAKIQFSQEDLERAHQSGVTIQPGIYVVTIDASDAAAPVGESPYERYSYRFEFVVDGPSGPATRQLPFNLFGNQIIQMWEAIYGSELPLSQVVDTVYDFHGKQVGVEVSLQKSRTPGDDRQFLRVRRFLPVQEALMRMSA